MLILAEVLRLGFLADFFSRPVLLGFINGVAVIIIVSQLPKFLGIKVHTDMGGVGESSLDSAVSDSTGDPTSISPDAR